VLAVTALSEEYPSLFPDAAERLAAAVNFLHGQGHAKIALVAHSMGARMGNHFLTRDAAAGIDAWVAIGISNGDLAEPRKLQLPVLDIYGERDFPPVLAKSAARAAVLRTLKGSAQVEVAGADHYFAGSEGQLVKQVKLFLDRRLQ
jgi:alpha/beta superfamily hydrolase